MTSNRTIGKRAHAARKLLLPAAALAVVLIVSGEAKADIDNTAAAVATYGSQTVTSGTSSTAVPVVAAQPALSIIKTPSVTTGVVAGQIITYTYVVTNTGNCSITNISLSETHNASGPVPAPAGETLSNDAGTSGDSTDATPNDGVWTVLAPGDSVTFTGSYAVTQSDVDTLQ